MGVSLVRFGEGSVQTEFFLPFDLTNLRVMDDISMGPNRIFLVAGRRISSASFGVLPLSSMVLSQRIFKLLKSDRD